MIDRRASWITLLWTLLLLGSMTPAAQAWLFKSNKVAPAPDKEDTGTITLVQIFLDEQMLGPGKIDGAMGTFTEQAVLMYNERWKVEPDNWWRLLREARRSVKNPYTTWTVRKSDWQYVGSLPYKPAEQETHKYMVYRSMAEFVSERFHTSENFLKKLNPDLNIYNLKSGDEVTVPNVTPFKLEDIPEYHSFEKLSPLSDRRAVVDTDMKTVKIFDGENMVASFPITPGQEKFIPYGEWVVRNMVTTPTFRYDKSMLEQGVRSDDYYELPPGPNSPVGIFWAGLNKSGIGLHGTNNPDTIGRARSAGCIRLANWDAIRLQSLIRPGAEVVVK